MNQIIIIGAGNWGTTLAHIFSRTLPVVLATKTAEHAQDINTNRENIRYLCGVRLSDSVRAAQFGTFPIEKESTVIVAVPSHEVRHVAQSLRNIINDPVLICASKGFEHTTMKTMSEILQEELPMATTVVMSGPNIAREIAEGKPTKAVLASTNVAALARLSRELKNDCIAFEVCHDVKGVELCAALKGIMAIGVGIADGLELGANFIGVLMTYGLREFVNIAEFLGISKKTIYGIAGLGDMIATCFSPESRNRAFGYLLGKGIPPLNALHSVGMVVEGVQMAKTIAELDGMNIPIPLFSTIAKIIFEPNGHLPDRFIHCLQQYHTN
ncbi:MAG: NAD(P)H-dependent glycerol-3-phosphate dehydrogenase [Desulfobacterota bacterium]|nr:NAD(P)H-dependent glycerol-3-phosphate dehydrogenase [Thermodesulfobacteriota bacterium]